jgi:DNA-binding transcriptional MerR regulator/methylmalonyl-CoA mutase cobalamin-binding subunit
MDRELHMDGNRHEQEPLHSMGVVCRRTGLKSDRLRAWEHRYGVVRPRRSEGNQRLYREADVERLRLLRRATDAGHRIAQIARLPAAELRALLEADAPRAVVGGWVLPTDAAGAPGASAMSVAPPRVARSTDPVGDCLAAIQQLDAERLRERLEAASCELGSAAKISRRLLVPLIEAIGELWAEGGLRAAHEHLGTAALRTFISGLRPARPIGKGAPRLLLTTPPGERHELGALLAGVAAGDCGWNATCLGPDLPAAEIAAAARQLGARAIGLSIVCPANDEGVAAELLRLRRHLGDSTGLVLGGRSAPRFEVAATQAGAVLVGDLVGLRPALALFGYRSSR